LDYYYKTTTKLLLGAFSTRVNDHSREGGKVGLEAKTDHSVRLSFNLSSKQFELYSAGTVEIQNNFAQKIVLKNCVKILS